MRAPKTRDALARAGVGFALFVVVAASTITFIPGGETWWFATAGFAAALGLLSPNLWVRLTALALVVVCAEGAWEGHRRGAEYEAYLRSRGYKMP